MADSDFVYLDGEPVDVGNAVENDFVFVEGELLSDRGASDFAFVEGRGIGGEQTKVAISDSDGESSGDVTIINRDQTVGEYYGYAETDSAAAEGDVNEFLDIRTTTFFVFQNDSTGEYSFGFVHDEYRPNKQDTGGDIHMSISGLPDGAQWEVRDDDPGNDSYSLSAPSASVEHLWRDENTDGLVIGTFTQSELEAVTVTFDVTAYGTNNGYVPNTVRFAGDGGTTVERSYEGTDTTVTIEFGTDFGE